MMLFVQILYITVAIHHTSSIKEHAARLTHAGHTFGWQKSQSQWPSAMDPAIITH